VALDRRKLTALQVFNSHSEWAFPRDIRCVCKTWDAAATPCAYREIDLILYQRNKGIPHLFTNTSDASKFCMSMRKNTKRVHLGEGVGRVITQWDEMNALLSACRKLELIK